MDRNANDFDATSTGAAGSSQGGSTSGAAGSGTGGLGNTGGLGGASSGAAMNSGAGTTGGSGFDDVGSLSGSGMNSGASLADSATAGAAVSPGIGAAGSTGGSYGAGTQGGRVDHMKDTVQSQAANAREKLGQAGEKARELKQNVEQTLAERLEAGASRLRARGASGGASADATSLGTPAYVGATGAAGAAGASSGAQLDELQDGVARGMQATADWLRNGDLKNTVEEQARSNPGRTLLVALGVGYLLGKAFRR